MIQKKDTNKIYKNKRCRGSFLICPSLVHSWLVSTIPQLKVYQKNKFGNAIFTISTFLVSFSDFTFSFILHFFSIVFLNGFLLRNSKNSVTDYS